MFIAMRKGAALMLLMTFLAGGLVATTLHPVVHSVSGSCHGSVDHATTTSDTAHETGHADAHHCDHSQHGQRFEPFHTALHGDICVLCTRQHLDEPDSDETPLVEPRRASGFASADLFSPDERPSSALRARAPPTTV